MNETLQRAQLHVQKGEYKQAWPLIESVLKQAQTNGQIDMVADAARTLASLSPFVRPAELTSRWANAVTFARADGEISRVVRALAGAAQAMQTAGDLPVAERYALDLWQVVEPLGVPVLHQDTLALLARIQVLRHRMEPNAGVDKRAVATLDKAVAACGDVAVKRVPLALLRASLLPEPVGALQDLMSHGDVQSSPALRAQVGVDLAAALRRRGDLDEAQAVATDARDQAVVCEDPVLYQNASLILAEVQEARGDDEQVVRTLIRAHHSLRSMLGDAAAAPLRDALDALMARWGPERAQAAYKASQS